MPARSRARSQADGSRIAVRNAGPAPAVSSFPIQQTRPHGGHSHAFAHARPLLERSCQGPLRQARRQAVLEAQAGPAKAGPTATALALVRQHRGRARNPSSAAVYFLRMALHRKLVTLLVVAGATLAAAGPAQAKIQIGISEQSPNMFANKFFKPLGVKYGRVVVPWNILARHDYWPSYLQAWIDGAAANGVEPMVAFNIQD